MGKKIDRFVLASILASALFFYFEKAFQSGLIAILLSLFCCMVISRFLRRFFRWIGSTQWQQKRNLRRKSVGMLMHLACMDDEEALRIVCQMLADGYQNNASVVLELDHPSSQLSRERIFSIWRSHRGSERLVICTTGHCTSEAHIFASSLKTPKLAIVDGDGLTRLMIEYPGIYFPTETERMKRKLRLNHIAQLIFNRRNAPRGILFSFSMLVMYIFSGNAWYLIASLLLLFVALTALRRVGRPAKLF